MFYDPGGSVRFDVQKTGTNQSRILTATCMYNTGLQCFCVPRSVLFVCDPNPFRVSLTIVSVPGHDVSVGLRASEDANNCNEHCVYTVG